MCPQLGTARASLLSHGPKGKQGQPQPKLRCGKSSSLGSECLCAVYDLHIRLLVGWLQANRQLIRKISKELNIIEEVC